MFDIGWGELVVIGIVALIAIGPKELPGVLRSVGQWVGKIKRMASDFQGQFQEAMREAEVADLKKQFDEASKRGDQFHVGLRQSARERQEPDRKLVQGNGGARLRAATPRSEPVTAPVAASRNSAAARYSGAGAGSA